MVTNLSGTWFTASRVDRLIGILRQVPSRHNVQQLPRSNVHRILFPVVGGTSEELRICVEVLEYLNLVAGSDFVRRTVEGDKVVRAYKNGDPTALPLAVVRSGCLSEQVQQLIAVADYDGDDLVFDASRVRSMAPQLFGLLGRLPDFVAGELCRIQGSLRIDIESAWTLHARPPGLSVAKVIPRVEVGNLAELYSVQLERTRFVGAALNVRWVSQEDPDAGYDIEVRDGGRLRRIEVKGSQSQSIAFLVSNNEWDAAERYSQDYEIHFWGTIRVGEKPSNGYYRLIDAGYPVVVANPYSTLSMGPWTMRPTMWRVLRDDSH